LFLQLNLSPLSVSACLYLTIRSGISGQKRLEIKVAWRLNLCPSTTFRPVDGFSLSTDNTVYLDPSNREMAFKHISFNPFKPICILYSSEGFKEVWLVWVVCSLLFDYSNLSVNRRPDQTEYVHLLHLPPLWNPQHSTVLSVYECK